MNSDRPGRSIRRQSEMASNMASDFDAEVVSDLVLEEIGDDRQLALILDTCVSSKQAHARRGAEMGDDAEFVDDVKDMHGRLSYIARQRALEVVAEACATVIHEADEWVDKERVSDTAAREARDEAREWLRHHTNEAVRVDVLEAISQ